MNSNRSRKCAASRQRNESGRQKRRRRLEVQVLEARITPSEAQFLFLPGGFLNPPQGGAPHDIVLGYLAGRASALDIAMSDLASLVVTDQYTDAHNGVTHIYFEQFAHGREVPAGRLNASVMPDGRIISIGTRLVDDIQLRALPGTPALSAEEAVFFAAASVGLDVPENLEVIAYLGGPAEETILEHADVSLEDVPTELVYGVDDAGNVRLAWQLVIWMPDAPDIYQFQVDANNGAILQRVNWTAYDSYRVFEQSLKSPDDGPRTLEVNPADPMFSPFGWHDTNGVAGAEFTDTRGNNVFAQEDGDANNSGGFRPSGGAGLLFDFALDLTQTPPNYQEAAIANLFYHNNILHDIHAHYGFTEAAGNFQETNYSGQGLGSDHVNADAQDGSGTNNANMGTPPDGFNPRMQMFIWTAANPDRDSDLDTQVIVHEYGHGVSTRLTGGPGNSSVLTEIQSGGMGEGWSDWWALSLLADATDTRSGATGIGMYLRNQPLSGAGIRRYRYSGDLTINPLTYGSVRGEGSVHRVGEIWCNTLWDMYWNLVDRYGYDPNIYSGTGGNNRALQLVMDGLKLQPVEPTLVQARNAILQADVANYGGANIDIIWKAFAAHGLGFSANDGGGSDQTDVIEAFDLPVGFSSSIAGQKFHDLDGDGVKEPGEPGLSNWTIYLDTNNNGVLDSTSTTTVASTDVPKNITDISTNLSNLVVSGLPANILDLNITLTISHTATGDLGAALISPNGTRVNLFAGIGGGGNNYTSTTFDDQAAQSVYTGAAPFSGAFRPTGQLARLIHENPNGTWRLQVWDSAGGDTGQLTGWSLNITTGEASVQTNALGNYTFANLNPNTYVVREVQQPLWMQTFPATGFHAVVLGTGQNPNNIHFGNTPVNLPPTNVTPGGPYAVQEGGNVNLMGQASDPEGDPLSFTWDVNGDGIFTDTSGQNPTLTWAQLQSLSPPIHDGVAGGTLFNVRVRVNDGKGNLVTSLATSLTVSNTSPTAALSNNGPVNEGSSSATVSFLNQVDPSTADVLAGFRYSYDFNDDGIYEVGDGLTYAGSVPQASQIIMTPLPDGPGALRVRARIFDKDGGFAQVTTDIVIANVAPTATLGNNGPIAEGGSEAIVSFSNENDVSAADLNAGFHYAYDFNNDGLFEIGNGTYAGSVTAASASVPANFLRDGPGMATIKARLIDKDGGSLDLFTDISLTNVEPLVAAPGSNPIGLEGTSTFFNLGSFTDPGLDNPWSVTVDWGDGQSESFSRGAVGTLGSRSHSYVDDGLFQVQVTVDDGDGGTHSSSFDVQVDNVRPTVLSPGMQTAVERQPSVIDLGGFTDPGVNDALWSVVVNWGDGSPVQSFNVAALGGLGQLVHQFPRDGTLNVKVTVTDADGGKRSRTFPVVVINTDIIITGTDAGGPPLVRVHDSSSNALLRQFNPFPDLPTFTGGVRVAAGDVDGDGVFDYIVGTGPGRAGLVRIFSGATVQILDTFSPYDPGFISQAQGVYVATGDINFDGRKDIITGAGGLSQQVSVFSYGTGVYNPAARFLFDRFTAFPGFGSIDGVTVASADVDGDGRDDIIAGAGPGGPSRVRAFKYTGGAFTRSAIADFQAFENTYRRGVFVAGADLNANGRAEIIVGVGTTSGRVTQDGPNGGRGLAPRVRVFYGSGPSFVFVDVIPYPPSVDTGVRVGALEESGQGKMFFATGHSVAGKVKKFNGKTLQEIDTVFSDPTFTRGLFVAGSR